MKKADYEKLKNRVDELEKLLLNGGAGSGNFGHSGRPGKVGGSSKERGKLGSEENRRRALARFRNNNLAHKEMAYVLRAVRNGDSVGLKDIENESAIKEAFERAKFDKDTLTEYKGDKKRQKLQKDLEDRLLSNENGSFTGKDEKGNEHFDGKVENGKEAYIVIGPPAGGKSSVFANPLSKEHNARIIDSDTVKKWLPEFDNGFGAGRVQEESSMIMENALKRSMKKGENMVIPKIGGESVAQMAKELKANGYKVHLKLNEVSTKNSVSRALSRFVETGRWLDPNYLNSIGDKATRFYKKYSKNKDLFDTAEWLNNNVPFGRKPKKIDKVD